MKIKKYLSAILVFALFVNMMPEVLVKATAANDSVLKSPWQTGIDLEFFDGNETLKQHAKFNWVEKDFGTATQTAIATVCSSTAIYNSSELPTGGNSISLSFSEDHTIDGKLQYEMDQKEEAHLAIATGCQIATIGKIGHKMANPVLKFTRSNLASLGIKNSTDYLCDIKIYKNETLVSSNSIKIEKAINSALNGYDAYWVPGYNGGSFSNECSSLMKLPESDDFTAKVYLCRITPVTLVCGDHNTLSSKILTYDGPSHSLILDRMPDSLAADNESTLGWYYKDEELVQGSTFSVSDKLTFTELIAKEYYKISYDLAGGIAQNATSYSAGDELLVNNPVKDGYTFKGWEVAGEDNIISQFRVTKDMHKNLFLRALWEKSPQVTPSPHPTVTPSIVTTQGAVSDDNGVSTVPEIKIDKNKVVVNGLRYKLYPKKKKADLLGLAYEDSYVDVSSMDRIGLSSNGKTKLVIPDRISVDGQSFRVVKIVKNAFKANQSIVSLEIGDNISTIGIGAFSTCENLKKVTTGRLLKTIKAKAFYQDVALQKVKIKSPSVSKVCNGSFSYCAKSLKVCVPKGSKKYYLKKFKKYIKSAKYLKES